MPHQQFQDCIDQCNACAVACEHCAASCLSESNVQEMAECIRLDLDCAAICRLASAYMARGSRFAKDLCGLCATACEACGAECERHSPAHCQECAQACRRCAQACRAIA